MSKALFFNALPDETSSTGYDRNYNADDLSDFLSMVCDTGVIKSNSENNEAQGLKVVAASGRTINVNAGKAAIRGKGFISDTLETFEIEANGLASNRYDYIVIRFDNNVNVRDIKLELKTGTTEMPTVASLTRSERVYELMLAYITVAPSATSITQANITDTRGDEELCPWFVAAKGYADYYDAIVQKHESVVTYTSTTVVTDLPAKLYNEKYSLIEVYTNGIKEPKTACTAVVSGGYINIAFATAKANGAKVTVVLSNFIDGEGMSTALAQYTQLVQDVANLNAAGEYDYICNGVNDNVLISNIIRAFYSIDDYKSLKLNVIGAIGISSAFSGEGTTASPFSWFNFIPPFETNRIATVDFTRASEITPTIANGTNNVIFRSSKINIIGANVIANNSAIDTVVKISNASSGAIKYENCRFWITAYKDSLIAPHGTFTNCRGSVANVINNSYCFNVSSSGLLRLNGGEYYAYAGDSNVQSAIVGQSGADAVSVLYGVSAPTVDRSGFYQRNSVLQLSGGGIMSCTDLISALPLSVISGASNIRGTIAKTKTNVW